MYIGTPSGFMLKKPPQIQKIRKRAEYIFLIEI